MNGYQALANGIIEQAVKDYREALRRLKKHPETLLQTSNLSTETSFLKELQALENHIFQTA